MGMPHQRPTPIYHPIKEGTMDKDAVLKCNGIIDAEMMHQDGAVLQHEPVQPRRMPSTLIEQVIGVVRVGFEQQQMRMVSSALAQLAKHMENGCPHAAYLAEMLLERVSADPAADVHLRAQARELVNLLACDPVNERVSSAYHV